VCVVWGLRPNPQTPTPQSPIPKVRSLNLFINLNN